MAYNDSFDINTPGDTGLIHQGDDAIRELKRALQERLATLTNFPTGEPLRLTAGALDNRTQIASSTLLSYMDVGTIDIPAGIVVPANGVYEGVFTVNGLTVPMSALPVAKQAIVITQGMPRTGQADFGLLFAVCRADTGVGGTLETRVSIANTTAAAINTIVRTLSIAVIRAVGTT